MRKFCTLLFICSLLIGFRSGVQAQTPVKKKPPVIFTQIGGFRDSVQLSVSEAEKVIGESLRIIDVNKNVYTISSYIFLYHRRIVTEDEKTGKHSFSTAIQSQRFRETPLPSIWVKTIREQVRPGEMLQFVDIIVKDAKGNVMYAPDLKITVR